MSFELASAYVRIFVEDSAVNKSLGNIRNNLAGTTTGIQKGMAGVRTGLAGTMTTLNRGIVQFTRNFKNITAPILSVAKWYMAAVTGLATKALHALYGDDSKAGRAWKKTFDVFKIRLNTEMARIANILLKVPIFGNTIPQWMDKLINFLRSMDLTKIKEMVKLFEKAAIAVAVIKGISIIGGIASGITGIGKMIEMSTARANKINAASNIGGGLLGGLGGGFTALFMTKRQLLWKKINEDFAGLSLGAKQKLFKGAAEHPFNKIPPAFSTVLLSPFKLIGALVTTSLLALKTAIMATVNMLRTLMSSMGIFTTNMAPLIASLSALKTAFSTFMTRLMGPFILPMTLISVLFYGLRDACQGLKIAFIALRDFLYSIPGVKPILQATGAVIKNVPKIGAFVGATASGVGGVLGELSAKSKKQTFRQLGASIVSRDISKAFNTASEDFFARNMFKKENEKWEAPDWKSMLPAREKIGGAYMGLTEGVKFAQDIQRKDNEYLRLIAQSTQSLNDLARGR